MATNNPSPPGRPLPRSRLFLTTTAVLFAAWIGWLAYLASTTTRPSILSRPQFLSAQLDVIAQLSEKDGCPDPSVVVAKVAWSRDPVLNPPENQPITVANLSRVTAKEGWAGPGTYILPLVKDNGGYALAPLGASPGFSASNAPPRIYPATPETLAQLQQIRGER
jgi:hypothetical protein